MTKTSSRRPAQDILRALYDLMLRRMQTRKTKAGMRRAFNTTPAELGRAAVEAGLKGR